MGSNNCFSKIIADVFPPWRCVKTHLNAPDQPTDKTSAALFSSHHCISCFGSSYTVSPYWIETWEMYSSD